jgi:hypothetical protein
MVPHPPTPILGLLAELVASPTSVAVWGNERPALTQLGLAIAQGLDRDFVWFDIRLADGTGDPDDVDAEPEAFGDRLRVITVDEMRLDDQAGNLADSMLIRESPPDPSTLTLLDLMRMPEQLREAATHIPTDSHPRAMLISNAERASAAFAGESGALRPYIEALNRLGWTVIVTSRSQPRANRADFDAVFRVGSGPGDVPDAIVAILDGVRPGSPLSAEPVDAWFRAEVPSAHLETGSTDGIGPPLRSA